MTEPVKHTRQVGTFTIESKEFEGIGTVAGGDYNGETMGSCSSTLVSATPIVGISMKAAEAKAIRDQFKLSDKNMFLDEDRAVYPGSYCILSRTDIFKDISMNLNCSLFVDAARCQQVKTAFGKMADPSSVENEGQSLFDKALSVLGKLYEQFGPSGIILAFGGGLLAGYGFAIAGEHIRSRTVRVDFDGDVKNVMKNIEERTGWKPTKEFEKDLKVELKKNESIRRLGGNPKTLEEIVNDLLDKHNPKDPKDPTAGATGGAGDPAAAEAAEAAAVEAAGETASDKETGFVIEPAVLSPEEAMWAGVQASLNNTTYRPAAGKAGKLAAHGAATAANVGYKHMGSAPAPIAAMPSFATVPVMRPAPVVVP